MRLVGLLAAVAVVLAFVSGCGDAQQERAVANPPPSSQPTTTNETWVIVDADSHGAVIGSGDELRGVDRSGRIAWQYQGDWDGAACNGSCPSALMISSGRVTSVSADGRRSLLPSPRQVNRILTADNGWLAFVRYGESPALVVQRLGQNSPSHVTSLPGPDALWHPTENGGMLFAYGEQGATALRLGYQGRRPIVLAQRQVPDGAVCTAGGGWPTPPPAGAHDSASIATLKNNASDCVVTKTTVAVVTTFQRSDAAAPSVQIDWVLRSGTVAHTRRFPDFSSFYFLSRSRQLFVSTTRGAFVLGLESAARTRTWTDAVDGLPIDTACVLVNQRGSVRWATC